jgi:hypothetical protein
MTPAAIIKRAMADGVNLALSTTGNIKATGERAAVNRWLSLIRENKPGIVAALQETGDVEPLPDPETEARRQRVLKLLAANPSVRYALVTDIEADPEAVIVVLAIRGRVSCELRIPREKYDPFLLLDLIERYGGIIH